MIVYAANARQIPTRRYMTGVKEQRAFNRAFPTGVARNLADSDGIAPMAAAHIDRWHPSATNE